MANFIIQVVISFMDKGLERVDLCCMNFVLTKRFLIATLICRPNGLSQK